MTSSLQYIFTALQPPVLPWWVAVNLGLSFCVHVHDWLSLMQLVKGFPNCIHSLDCPVGTHACFVDQLSCSAPAKGSPEVPFLSFPWGTFYLGLFHPFLATVSLLLLYAASKPSLLLDQLQLSNSDSCESWHAFICHYLRTYLTNVSCQYGVLGKYRCTCPAPFWCFWSWI